jgi:hypothetical protein
MTTAELKLILFRQIDSLDKSKLEEFYGVFLNFFNGEIDSSDWNNLTNEQKTGIDAAIKEINAGKFIPHDKVMSDIYRKYRNV